MAHIINKINNTLDTTNITIICAQNDNKWTNLHHWEVILHLLTFQQ